MDLILCWSFSRSYKCKLTYTHIKFIKVEVVSLLQFDLRRRFLACERASLQLLASFISLAIVFVLFSASIYRGFDAYPNNSRRFVISTSSFILFLLAFLASRARINFSCAVFWISFSRRGDKGQFLEPFEIWTFALLIRLLCCKNHSTFSALDTYLKSFSGRVVCVCVPWWVRYEYFWDSSQLLPSLVPRMFWLAFDWRRKTLLYPLKSR